ncbi:hypothetical protein BV921_07475 [Pectobacterium odoriferum]|uniref:Uncharacterized protein n=1 Tax=Pectobacterium odoriferum TaxID=78398 RepID=A0ABD6VSM5_9GAMM|nr:hypothetical protein BV925_12180 [Pectobacterium odoriferum]POD97743.1 hypothetical protein BVY06_04665 [Pectobacterium odoriferum]POE03031.1 hypothetical protein BVY05_03925 [Pectobacterium odoriferum]POE06441.1 hypothetical protein BV916_00770 [Pectobacterium odoriferum]POE10880.1 hypothetical protein BV921_07475 [Pectobacterium odoriferum]
MAVQKITPLYSSYFKLHVRWLRLVTRITYSSKLIGIPSLAAFLKLELFRVYDRHLSCLQSVDAMLRASPL